MKNDHFAFMTPFLILIMLVVACGSTASASNPYLETLLGASDDREFNNALSIYGTLKAEDVGDVVKAVESSSTKRRKYGAWMLKLCRLDSCHQPQIDEVRKTKDVVVWANLVEVAGKNEAAVLRERPEMLTKALDSEEAEILAPALRVALKIERDGINEKCRMLLDSKDEKILEVVLNNLSPSVARQESPRLVKMLEDDKTYHGVSMQIAMAIIRGEDNQYYPQIKAFVDRLKKDKSDHSFFNETTFSADKQTVDFLWQIARLKTDEGLGELRHQAYDSLARRVWAPDMHEPVTYELMEMTLVYLKQVSPDTNPRAHFDDPQYGPGSASYLVAFINKGNTDFESRLWGKDAVAFTEKWLRDNKNK